MLPVTWTTVRLFLHVLAATVWVGGQLTLAGLVPGLRDLSDSAPRAVARSFNRIAWPAFAVLAVTGIWNVAAEAGKHHPSGWGLTLAFKIAVVALSGASAALHAQAKSRLMIALMGALSGLTALVALFLGVLLTG
jgi:putative copper export protein